MPEPKRPPEPWNAFFTELDSALTEETQLRCIGGFVINMSYDLIQSTADVDFVEIVPHYQLDVVQSLAGRNSALHRKYGLYLDFVTVTIVPENYEERWTAMFAGA